LDFASFSKYELSGVKPSVPEMLAEEAKPTVSYRETYLDLLWLKCPSLSLLLHALFYAFQDIMDDLLVVDTEKLCQLCCPTPT
jgi:hypothetical protein